MGPDIRKELSLLKGMKNNSNAASFNQSTANEFNSILDRLLANGVDVEEFRIKPEDVRPVKSSAIVLPGRRPKYSWSDPLLSHSTLHTKLDGLLDYLDSQEEGGNAGAPDSMAILSAIGTNFPRYVRPLTNRQRSSKKPFEIEDEYDVQDLIHAALNLHFDDVRPEEPTPSYVNKGSRIDFFLHDEGIAIEVKYMRDKAHAKDIGSEITDDVARYNERQDCSHLVAYIYDPNHYIENQKGAIKDLEKHRVKGNHISVYICN